MNFWPLGDSGIQCSVVGLGTGRLASVSGGVSRAAAEKLFGVAEDCGINFIDTADSYGQGECERIIGRAIAGRRDKFIITTKAGFYFSSLGGGLRLLKPLAKRALKFFRDGRQLASQVRANVSRQDFTPETLRQRLHASLGRLQTDCVDVFLLHSPPPEVMTNARVFELLRALKREGKLRFFGVSSPDPAVLAHALQIEGLSIVQTAINPALAAPREWLPKFQAAKIPVVANQIFLSGKLLGPPVGAEGENLSALLQHLQGLAASRQISLNRLLTQYALSQPGVTAVLTGTTKPERLRQIVADALATGGLSPREIAAAGALAS